MKQIKPVQSKERIQRIIETHYAKKTLKGTGVGKQSKNKLGTLKQLDFPFIDQEKDQT